jgi:hypothetical protein
MTDPPWFGNKRAVGHGHADRHLPASDSGSPESDSDWQQWRLTAATQEADSGNRIRNVTLWGGSCSSNQQPVVAAAASIPSKSNQVFENLGSRNQDVKNQWRQKPEWQKSSVERCYGDLCLRMCEQCQKGCRKHSHHFCSACAIVLDPVCWKILGIPPPEASGRGQAWVNSDQSWSKSDWAQWRCNENSWHKHK